MRSIMLYFCCLAVFPLVPVFDIAFTAFRCSICLCAYPFFALASLVCLVFDRSRSFKILNYWRKVANIGTKYEEEI